MKYSFEDFEIDGRTRELTKSGAAVPVTAQTFDLLWLLIENRGMVVSREAMLEIVWKKAHVSTSTLYSQINAARSAIGDDGRSQRLVQTVSKRGLRFAGSAVTLQETAADGVEFPTQRRYNRAAISSEIKTRVAVMPISNVSKDEQVGHFCDGLRDVLIGALSRIRAISVLSSEERRSDRSSSSSTYLDRPAPDFFLEGSVQHLHGDLRIALRVVDSATGICMWANRFNGTIDRGFVLQDEVESSVHGALDIFFETKAASHLILTRTPPATADDYYKLGMLEVRRDTKEGMRRALTLLKKSLQLDPDNALAHSAAAWCYVWLKLLRGVEEADLEQTSAIEHARTALQLNSDDPLVLVQSAYALGHFEGDLSATLEHFDRALALDPMNASALFLSGAQMISAGATARGLQRVSDAARLNPNKTQLANIKILESLGNIILGHHQEAYVDAREAYRLMPRAPQTSAVLAASHSLQGNIREAGMAIKILRDRSPDLNGSRVSQWVNLQRSDDMDLFREALIAAGLPR